jgi:hypothetical protein
MRLVNNLITTALPFMLSSYSHFLLGLGLAASGLSVLPPAAGFALDLKGWEGATNRETKERFIPVELWSGLDWDGKRELKMLQVDGRYRHGNVSYQIKGPTEWKHPNNGETYLVYERLNPGRRAGDAKWQLFAINQEQSGLGRVYDARPDLGTRTMSGGLKFPLGYWKEGETRKLTYKHYNGPKESSMVEFITVKQIDFSFIGNDHCLEFYWALTRTDERKTLDHHTYVYCPGKSMVSEILH